MSPVRVYYGTDRENGAGKSTTIKMILDLVRKDHGEIRVFGEKPKILWHPAKKR